MSKKTTLKRIALVAVSALGVGLFSAVPSQATYSASADLSASYMTVVGATGTTTNSAVFYVDVTNAATTSTKTGLYTNESISVTVTADPDGTGTATTVGDLTIDALDHTGSSSSAGSFTADIPGCVEEAAAATTYQVPNGGSDCTAEDFASNDWNYSTTYTTGASNRYWFAVYPTSSGTPTGKGYYTIRVRVHAYESATVTSTIDKTLNIRWVSTNADSGASITVTKAGDLYDGEPLYYETNRYIQAVLKDPNGGRVVKGASVTDSLASRAPDLNARILDEDGAVEENIEYVYDTGVHLQDHVQSATTTATSTVRQFDANKKAGDGTYGLYDSDISADVSSTHTVSVRLNGTNIAGTSALVVRDTSTAIDNKTDLTLAATGLKASEALIKEDVSTTTAYTLPLSTTEATLTINVDGASTSGIANQAITTKVTWSGAYASANVTPASATSTTTFTNSSGNTSVKVTNSAPLAGAKATILITGFAFASGSSSGDNSSGYREVTITWAEAIPTTVSVADPVAGVYVKTGSSTVFSVTVLDQFGNAMADKLVRPSLSSDSENYSATTTYDAVKTNASGVATWTLTDAAAATDDFDKVTFTELSQSVASSAFTITYKATLPTVGSAGISGFFNDDFDAAAASITASIPSTGIVDDLGARLALKNDRNISLNLAANTEAAENDMLAIKIRAVTSAGAAARGASLTLAAGDGGHVLNTSGLPSASRTIAIDSDGYAVFQILATKPGLITFTATSGTATYSFTANIAVPTQTAARTVTLTGASTGTANGEGVPMTVKVTDRYGNGVSGVTLTVSASGAGAFMGGSTTQSYTTDSTGTYTFLATSLVEAGGAATFSATMTNAGDSTSAAARSAGAVVDSTLAAGVNSASASVTFTAGRSATTVAAEAATDAALEAIDAANAATDAANLAAEAADAATVAAEEARDAADAATAAVEALASEVATLIAGLKAQITTLANTVAKIAKKVKA